MKKRIVSVILALLTLLFAFPLSACDETEGPVDLAGKNVFFHFQQMDIEWDIPAYTAYYEDADDNNKAYSVTLTMQEFAERFVGTDFIYEWLPEYKELFDGGAEQYNLDTVEGLKNAIRNNAINFIGTKNPRIIFYSDASKATAYKYGGDLTNPLKTYTVQNEGIGYNLYDENNELQGSLYAHGKENIKVVGPLFPTQADLMWGGVQTTDGIITLTASDGSTIERNVRLGTLTANLKLDGGFAKYKVSRT